MKKRDRVRILATAAAGAATVASLGLTGAIGAGASRSQVSPRLQPTGVDFTIHSDVDPNYCLEDSVAPDNPASEAEVSQCASRDNQHWTFAHAADGSEVIVGGSVGDCLDLSAKKYVSMIPCTFSSAERFLYSKTGQIESTSKTKCLQAEAATQGGSVSIVNCQKGVALQVWMLSH